MRYERFDADVFDSVAGYVVPKVLGCFGIGVVVTVVSVLLVLLAQQLEWLGPPVAILLLLGFIPGIVYGSMRFDAWHNRRQVERRRRGR